MIIDDPKGEDKKNNFERSVCHTICSKGRRVSPSGSRPSVKCSLEGAHPPTPQPQHSLPTPPLTRTTTLQGKMILRHVALSFWL